MKKAVAVLMTVVLFLSIKSPVAAATETVMPRYTYTNCVSAYLDIDTTWGIAYCKGECIAYNYVPVKVMVYLEYYSESNESWKTVKIWQVEDTGFAGLEAYYAVYSGFQYRVRTVGYVYNSNGVLVEIVSAKDTFNYY